MSKVEGKKDVTMLTTIHEVVMVEMGKHDALGKNRKARSSLILLLI